ncbi:Flp pilus assembly protein CpaB [Planctomicrobium sp. SH664]|uniref:Flp pilus assembly protein CpaB n=1 Tax=Planctomicrobium sp. SH664 TaxID=3448125 RepID=UPI003F5BA75D
MKPKTLVLLAVAVGCGLVAMLGVQQAMQGGQQPPPKIETAKVLVALENIDTGSRLTTENVAFKERAIDSVPEDAIRTEEDFNQRAARVPLIAGDIVRKMKLTEKGEFGKSVQIPKGMRVWTINVDDTHTNCGLLKPGDRVDVLVTYQGVSDRGAPISKSTVLLEYVEVFATDNNTATKLDEKKDGSRAKNVSLLLTPEQVNFVALAQRKGTLQLSWRNKGDDEITKTKGVDEKLLEELEGSIGLQDNYHLYTNEERAPRGLFDEPKPVEPAPAPAPEVVHVPVAVEPEPAPEPPVPTWTVDVFSGNQMVPHEFEIRNGVPVAVQSQPPQGAAPVPRAPDRPVTAPVSGATKSTGGSTVGMDAKAMEEMMRTLGAGKASGRKSTGVDSLLQ